MRAERLRFSPAPTDRLHVGLGRTAVFNWLYARRSGGELLLRIDDTDPALAQRELAPSMIETLRWLGIDWSGEVNFQSERAEQHRAAAQRLLASGAAYRDFSAPARRGEGPRVHRQSDWRALSEDDSEARAAAGERFVLRLRLDDDGAEPEYEDLIFGARRCPQSRIEDFVILRADGSPTYHLATVLDDAQDAITLVLRGQEHIPSTMRQLLLYEALDLEPPRFAHLPLLSRYRDPKSRQRAGQKSLEDYRRQSVLPSALRHYLATLGWSAPAGQPLFVSDGRLVETFDLGRVSRVPVTFDEARLMEINEQHLRHLPAEQLVPTVVAELERRRLPPPSWGAEAQRSPEEMALASVDLARSHASTVQELVDQSGGLLAERFVVDEELLEAVCRRLPVGLIVAEILEECSQEHSSWDSLYRAIQGRVLGQDLSSREVLTVLQVALTGAESGPPPGEVFELLGLERVEARLRGLSRRCGCEELITKS